MATVVDLRVRFGVLLLFPLCFGERRGLTGRFVPIALHPDGNSSKARPRRCCSGYLHVHGLP